MKKFNFIIILKIFTNQKIISILITTIISRIHFETDKNIKRECLDGLKTV